MPVELRVPKVGESITEVQVGDWLISDGDPVQRDQPVVVLETDKATVELPAPVAGKVTKRLKAKGEIAKVGEVIGLMEEGAVPAAAKPTSPAKPAELKPKVEALPAAGPAAPAAAPAAALSEGARSATESKGARRVPPSKRHREEPETKPEPVPTPPPGITAPSTAPGGREEEVVPMSLIRRKIAERLVSAKQQMALLTTFNEIDMSAVVALRKHHQEAFTQKYGVKLGFMSFFVKAAIDALRQFPQANAEIRGTDVVYHNFYDIGIAVGGGKGLLVPVLRNAERLSFAEIEVAIADLGKRAQEGKIAPDELKGGTFTISNGGVYGSLMSTPIVNPPQTAILGLHAIQDRPVARDGQVVIRPMMYVAVTYDHRIIDGRESVAFLKRIKEAVEEPARMLVEI